MNKEILLSDGDYRTLRFESRKALDRAGVPSNPGFTNGDIISSLVHIVGVPPITFPKEMELSEYSGEFFRDALGEVLGLEIPPKTSDITIRLRDIQ